MFHQVTVLQRARFLRKALKLGQPGSWSCPFFATLQHLRLCLIKLRHFLLFGRELSFEAIVLNRGILMHKMSQLLPGRVNRVLHRYRLVFEAAEDCGGA